MKFSNSPHAEYFRCPYKRYLEYHKDGIGWIRKGINFDTLMGTFCHSAICGFLMSAELEEAISMAKLEFGQEVAGEFGTLEANKYVALGEGLVRCWVKQRAPIFQQYYEVLNSEQEYEVPLGNGITLMVRPDLELKRKSDGEIWACEFKTMGYNQQDYFDSWRYSIQTLTHCLALDRKYGKPCAGVMMEFLYKGYKKNIETGVEFYSPLVRGYSAGPLPPFGEERIEWDSSFGKRKAYSAVFVPDKMSMAEWIEQLPVEILDSHLFTREIFRHQDELERWVAQARDIEGMISHAMGELDQEVTPILSEEYKANALRRVFPQRLDRYCRSNEYRRQCPYLEHCFNGMDLEESGLFEKRKPHHEAEFSEE